MSKATLGALMKSKVEAVRATLKRDMTPTEQSNYETAMFEALADAIISHIHSNATIAPLSTSETPAGQGPHVHDVSTEQLTGKIS